MEGLPASGTAPSLPTMAEQIAVDQISPDTFTSRVHPQRMGNAAPIAYGGCTAGVAVHSACLTLPQDSNSNFHLYSVLGAFHGPTRIDRKLKCVVTRTRSTKTFQTRRVVASQTMDDGSERTCADFFVDFHVREAELFGYSARPSMGYGVGPMDPTHTAPTIEVAERLVRDGHISREAAEANGKMFAMAESFFETRQCTDGVSGQNLMGLAKDLTTTQDDRHITDKTSAEWLRTRTPLANEAENCAALAFIMDGALSFLPLNLDHKNFGDSGACSTLDFALRVMRPGVRMDGWHFRERRTVAAAAGRSYSESRLWDEGGGMVAVMTQSCIIRPPPAGTKAKL
ncbi:hypothetical protein OHC33_003447 [Knufia fluminis]|uniref:Uncharacterized protein n=1 Tax=Knufia fluminis TaxID=191047 RepID=A0AAN8I9N3_9EURO|nr:hypothetical protein OHC33_003447 [Knufia fluminis]